MRLRFPIIGHGLGPGAKLRFFRLLLLRRYLATRKRARVKSHVAAYVAIVEASIAEIVLVLNFVNDLLG